MAYCKLNPVTVATTRSNDLLAAIGSNATISVYTGNPPSDPSVAPTGTLLATYDCSATFGVVTPGVSGGNSAYITANAIAQSSGVATGTPGYARIYTSGGVGVMDVDCGATGSGAYAIIAPDQIVQGAWTTVNSLVISEG